MNDMDSIQKKWADRLASACETRKQTDSLVASAGELSIGQAYAVQAALIDRRLNRGERVIGWKVGATSRSVMKQLHIDEPIFGCMTTQSSYPSLRPVKASDFCRLAVEAEIALVMGKHLEGPGVTSADVFASAAGAMGVVELVDCRVTDWQPQITEAIADNSLHAGIILGPVMNPIIGRDLRFEGAVIKINGRLLASGCGVEALGNPVDVVAWLANKLARSDRMLKQGDIVSTGSLTSFIHVQPGDLVDVSFSSLGNIQFLVED